MAANGLVRIVMQVTGLSSVRAAMRGAATEARRADASIAQGTRARASAERALAGEVRGAARTRTATAVESNRTILRSTEQRVRDEVRLEQRLARETRQAMRRERVGRGGRPGGSHGGIAVGAGVSAGVSDAMGRVSRFSSAIGVPTTDQMVGSTIDRGLRLTRLGVQAGIGPEGTADLTTRVADVSRRTLVSQDDITAGLEQAHGRFSRLEFFTEHIEELSRAAMVSGASLEDMVTTTGEFQRQLDVTDAEFHDMIGSIMQAAATGSIEVADLAANFSGTFLALRNLRGVTGGAAIRESLAVTQVLGSGGLSAEETRTRQTALTQSLSRTDVQRRIERGLGDREIFDERGRMTVGFDDLFQRMSQDEDFQGATALQEVFGGRGESQEAAAILMRDMTATANPIRDIMNASSDDGNDQIDSGMDALKGSAAGQALALVRNTEANFASNGDAVVSQMTAMVAPLAALNSRFPMASEALGVLASVASAAGLALGAKAIIGGGAAGAGAAGAGAAGAGGLLGGVGAVLAGVAAPVAAAGALAFNWLMPESAGDAGTPEQAAAASRRPQMDDAARRAFTDEREQFAPGTRGTSPELQAFTAAIRALGGQQVSAEMIRQIGDAVRAGARAGVADGAPQAGRTPGEPRR